MCEINASIWFYYKEMKWRVCFERLI